MSALNVDRLAAVPSWQAELTELTDILFTLMLLMLGKASLKASTRSGS